MTLLMDGRAHTRATTRRCAPSKVHAGFYVDLIHFRQSYNPSEALPPATLLISSDDRAVKYSTGSWDWPQYGGYMRITEVPGAGMQLAFIGTKATWVGWLPMDRGTAEAYGTYIIDGGAPIDFVIPAFPADANETLRYQTFFATPSLPRAEHKLEVVYKGPAGAMPLVLDYILVEDGSPLEAGIASDGTPVAAIIGGAVGGVAAALAIIAMLLFLLRRRRRLAQAQAQATTWDEQLAPTPFAPPPQPAMAHAWQPSDLYAGRHHRQTERHPAEAASLLSPLPPAYDELLPEADAGEIRTPLAMVAASGGGADTKGELRASPSIPEGVGGESGGGGVLVKHRLERG